MLNRVRRGRRLHEPGSTGKFDQLGEAIVIVAQRRDRWREQELVSLGLDETEGGRVGILARTGKDVLQEEEILSGRAKEPTATRVKLQFVLGIGFTDCLAGQGNKGTPRRAGTDLHQPRPNVFTWNKSRILQAKRLEHFLLEVLLERMTADTFDEDTGPVDAGAVDIRSTGFVDEGRQPVLWLFGIEQALGAVLFGPSCDTRILGRLDKGVKEAWKATLQLGRSSLAEADLPAVWVRSIRKVIALVGLR